MRARRTSIILSAVLLVPAVLAAPAFAKANRVSLYDVRMLLRGDGSRVMLVAAQLAPSVSLPAEVQLPVAKGAKIEWTGEILGGDPSLDPPAAYRAKKGPDYDFAVFTLNKARQGQVEYSVPTSAPSRSTTRAKIAWKAPDTADTAQLVVILPSGVQGKALTPGVVPNATSDGSTAYVKRFSRVSKGQRLDLSVQYTGGSATGQTPAQPNQQQPAQPNQQPLQSGQPQTDQREPASPVMVLVVFAVILVVTFYLLGRVRPDKATGAATRRTRKSAR